MREKMMEPVKQEETNIRIATLKDAEDILQIYAPYVEHTAITFEYTVPSVGEFQERMKHTLIRYPYLVAVQGTTIVGYAYTGAFKERAAYDWAVELSIYVKEGCHGIGIGQKLYDALEMISKKQHILNLNACIAYPERKDEYLTKDSLHFHEHLGYSLVGKFHNCGYKFGRWYHMVWMEKMIGEHPEQPEPVIPFSQMR